MASGCLLPGSLRPSTIKAGEGSGVRGGEGGGAPRPSWGGGRLGSGARDASCGHWTPTFQAIPKTHSSSLLALPSLGRGQCLGRSWLLGGLSRAGLRFRLEGLPGGRPVQGTALGVLVILINRKSPPSL